DRGLCCGACHHRGLDTRHAGSCARRLAARAGLRPRAVPGRLRRFRHGRPARRRARRRRQPHHGHAHHGRSGRSYGPLRRSCSPRGGSTRSRRQPGRGVSRRLPVDLPGRSRRPRPCRRAEPAAPAHPAQAGHITAGRGAAQHVSGQREWTADRRLNPNRDEPLMSPAGGPRLATLLMPRLPFFYGWVILACACSAGFARQGPAVATLSIFVEPMTREFGWTRTALSGAVSLGGIMAALASPLIGPVLDRRGARLVLCLAVLTTGLTTMLLSLTQSLAAFYVFFCIARMNFAGPFELGIYGALNSWFVARRAFVTSIANLAQMGGLVAMPLIAHFAMQHDGWRAGWITIGTTVLLVGFVPTWLLMVRRPEDAGLVPDRREPAAVAAPAGAGRVPAPIPEPTFSRAEALHTPAFWLLSLYTLTVYPVQAGVSLHQAPYLIECGLSPAVA